ncbi:hypothetical protein JHK86_033856 [Glycine max]|nr:hypothetical protein JHK86_033856 [Glycine max]
MTHWRLVRIVWAFSLYLEAVSVLPQLRFMQNDLTLRYDLELHMVHVSTQLDGTNKTAVVGILYKYGSPDPLLSKSTSSHESPVTDIVASLLLSPNRHAHASWFALQFASVVSSPTNLHTPIANSP